MKSAVCWEIHFAAKDLKKASTEQVGLVLPQLHPHFINSTGIIRTLF